MASMSRRDEAMGLSATITSLGDNTNKWNMQKHQGRREEIVPAPLDWAPLFAVCASTNSTVLYSRQSEQPLNAFADDGEQIEEQQHPMRITVNVEASRSTIITISNFICDALI